MHITIKTQEEFQRDHVTVVIQADRAEVDGAESSPLTIDRVQEAVLHDEVAKLERQRGELTSAMDAQEIQHLRETDDLRVKIRELGQKAEMFKAQAYSENERADHNKAWAERAEANGVQLSEALVQAEEGLKAEREKTYDERARANNLAQRLATVEQSLEARDRLLAEATKDRDLLAAQIGKVVDATHGAYILSALQTPWQSWTEQQAVALTRAVQDTRRAIGSPGVGTDTQA